MTKGDKMTFAGVALGIFMLAGGVGLILGTLSSPWLELFGMFRSVLLLLF